ncbi:MAG: dockerin type I domain-containing protein [Planctomycetota bacterium]
MRNRIVLGTVVSLALVLAFTASAQAVSIGVNLCTDAASSQVSPSLSDGYAAQTNWNNANMSAGCAFVSPAVDSTGAAVTSGLSLGLDLNWNGGWSYYYAVSSQGNANTLGHSGWEAQYGPIIHINNIPYTAYNVAVLTGGYGSSDLKWEVDPGSGSSYTTPSYKNGGGGMYAFQIIDTSGAATPVLLTAPSTVNLGRIIKGAVSPSQNISVTESGGVATTYDLSAVSNANFTVADAGTTGKAIAASSINTHAVTADTSTAGIKSASITVAGTAVAMDATVLEHANGTFANTTGVLSSANKVLTLNFGTVSVGTGGGNIDSSFDIYANVVGAATANLDLTGIVGDLSKLTGLSTFSGLVAGSSHAYTFSFNTSAAGTLSASYTFNLADEAGVLGGTTDSLTLNVTGRVSHPGDVNSDGTVNFLDYNIVKTNYLSSGVGWAGGDLNGDGTVNFLDYNIVKTHYLHTDATIGVQAIPEPATLALLALAGLAIRRKRQG